MADKATGRSTGSGPSSAGVAQLISRLREEGVAAGEKAGKELLAEAEAQAKQIVADARQRADRMVEEARAEVTKLQEAGEQALRLAGRDAMLRLERRLMSNFETLTRSLVRAEMVDPEFLRQLIVEVTRSTVEESGIDQVKEIQVLLPAGDQTSAGAGEANAKLEEAARAIMASSWRDGVTFAKLTPGHAGIKVRMREKGLEVDLTADAVAGVLLAHLQPRFRSVLHGLEAD